MNPKPLATLVLALLPAWGQTQPTDNRPIHIVIPFAPGGAQDVVGRYLGNKLAARLGVPVVVENKAGAGGVIAAEAVAKSSPDGRTLLLASGGAISIAPHLNPKLPYDPKKDFAPVALVAKAPLSVAINKNLPVTDIKSLLAYAKANPGKLTFAVGSVGSAGHLATELLKHNGLDYTVVPYKGTAPAFQDLIGGQISGFIDPILGSLQYHKNGLLRVVAVTSAHRTPNLPDVPTVSETLPGYEFYSWYGLWAPVKAPQEVKDLLNAQVNKALASDMKDKLISQGLIVGGGSIEDFRKFQADDMARSQKLITDGNIRLE